MKSSYRNRIKKSLVLSFAVLFTAAVVVGCSCQGCSGSRDASGSTEETSPQSQPIDNTVEWKGKKYKYNNDLTNIMFLGIDRSDPIGVEDLPGTASQADCIMLLILDESTKEARILQINRNSMTTIDIYDNGGNKVSDMKGQINLQYAYCTGGANSCWATKKTLSRMLYGLPIDGYFTINFEALADINDDIGGVEVTMEDDYTYIDPAFVKGETVRLTGKQAERFVRYRDTNEFNSVQGRMERQAEYVSALAAQMKKSGGSKLYDILSPYLDEDVLTDMDASQINALKNYTYAADKLEYLPGEMKMGEKYEEFYIDDEAMQDLIFELFYNEVS